MAWRKQDQSWKIEKALPKVKDRDEGHGFMTRKQAKWENSFTCEYSAVRPPLVQWMRALWEGRGPSAPRASGLT